MAKYKWICNDPQRGGNTWRAKNANSCPKCGSEDIEVIASSPPIWPWILGLLLVILIAFLWMNRCSISPSICDSIDSIKNKVDKENKAPKLTDRQKDIIQLSSKLCNIYKLENELLQMEKYYDWYGEYENEKEYFFLEQELDLAEEDFYNYNDLFGKKYEDHDNIEKAIEDFNILKKECEKCKEAIENVDGWDNFISSFEEEINSFYEEDLDYGWSDEEKTKFLDECNAEPVHEFVPEFCNCALDVLMSRYETPKAKTDDYTKDDFRVLEDSCYFYPQHILK